MIVGVLGSLGKHSSFVIDESSCLIIDFESTSIRNVRSRIPVNSRSISEIRTGYNSGMARVIVDFGQNPVPRFQVMTEHNFLLVVFDEIQDTSRDKSLREATITEVVGLPRSESSGTQLLTKPVGITLEKTLFSAPAAPPATTPLVRRDPHSSGSGELAATDYGGTFERNAKGNQTAPLNASITALVSEAGMRSPHDADHRGQTKPYHSATDSHVNAKRVNDNIRGDFAEKARATRLADSPVVHAQGARPVPAAAEFQKARSTAPAAPPRKSSSHISGEGSTSAVNRGWPLRIEVFEPKARTDR